jgi:uncharacterized membrane protein YkoI
MNRLKTIIATIAIAHTPAIGSAQDGRRELRLEECPRPVQAAVQDNARGGRIDDVDLIMIEGRQIYVAEVDLPRDRELKIYIAGNGSLMKTIEEILLSELPETVRDAAQALGPVEDVEKETSGQTLTYHVEIDRKGRADLEVLFSADGMILRQTEEAED